MNQLVSVRPSKISKNGLNGHTRPMQTVMPLSVNNGLTIQLFENSEHLAENINSLRSEMGSVFVSWHHGKIYRLARLIGIVYDLPQCSLDELANAEWADEDFTSALVISQGKYEFYKNILPRSDLGNKMQEK